jgi:hypothetical protein
MFLRRFLSVLVLLLSGLFLVAIYRILDIFLSLRGVIIYT